MLWYSNPEALPRQVSSKMWISIQRNWCAIEGFLRRLCFNHRGGSLGRVHFDIYVAELGTLLHKNFPLLPCSYCFCPGIEIRIVSKAQRCEGSLDQSLCRADRGAAFFGYGGVCVSLGDEEKNFTLCFADTKLFAYTFWWHC